MRDNYSIWIVDDISPNVDEIIQDLRLRLRAYKEEHVDACSWSPAVLLTSARELTLAKALAAIDGFTRDTLPEVAIFDVRLDGVQAGAGAGEANHHTIATLPEGAEKEELTRAADLLCRRLEKLYGEIGQAVYDRTDDMLQNWEAIAGESLREVKIGLMGPVDGPESFFLQHGGWFLGEILLARARDLGAEAPAIVYYSGSRAATHAMLPTVVSKGTMVFPGGKGSGTTIGRYVDWALRQRAIKHLRRNHGGALSIMLDHARAIHRNYNCQTTSPRKDKLVGGKAWLKLLTSRAFRQGRTLASLRPDLLSPANMVVVSGSEARVTENQSAAILSEIERLLGSPSAGLRAIMEGHPWQGGLHWTNCAGKDSEWYKHWDKVGRKTLTEDTTAFRQYATECIGKLSAPLSAHLAQVDPTKVPGDAEMRIAKTLTEIVEVAAREPANFGNVVQQQGLESTFFSIPCAFRQARNLAGLRKWDWFFDWTGDDPGSVRAYMLTDAGRDWLLRLGTWEACTSYKPASYWDDLLGRLAVDARNPPGKVRMECRLLGERVPDAKNWFADMVIDIFSDRYIGQIPAISADGDFGALVTNPWVTVSLRTNDDRWFDVSLAGGLKERATGEGKPDSPMPYGFNSCWRVEVAVAVRL